MVAIIFNIKKFDDVIDFNLWHVQMMKMPCLQSSCASRIGYCRRY
ncbi:hypothetical protein Gotur_025833 [Gossypium turneri]